VAAGGVGLVTLGVGGYFLADALQKNGVERGAESSGNVATVLGVTGAVALGAAVTLYLLGGDTESASSRPLLLGVFADDQQFGASAWGRF
jgi:hypothetical protein